MYVEIYLFYCASLLFDLNSATLSIDLVWYRLILSDSPINKISISSKHLQDDSTNNQVNVMQWLRKKAMWVNTVHHTLIEYANWSIFQKAKQASHTTIPTLYYYNDTTATFSAPFSHKLLSILLAMWKCIQQ